MAPLNVLVFCWKYSSVSQQIVGCWWALCTMLGLPWRGLFPIETGKRTSLNFIHSNQVINHPGCCLRHAGTCKGPVNQSG